MNACLPDTGYAEPYTNTTNTTAVDCGATMYWDAYMNMCMPMTGTASTSTATGTWTGTTASTTTGTDTNTMDCMYEGYDDCWDWDYATCTCLAWSDSETMMTYV
jgi:hypothetical protein